MAIRSTIFLLFWVTGCAVLAQSPEGDSSHKGTNSPRRFKPNTPRITPTAQSVFSNQRFRKPIPIKSRPTPTSEIVPEVPIFTPGGGGRGFRHQAQPQIHLNSNSNTESEENGSTTHSQEQPNSKIKPVNEENEKEEDVAQVISNLGSVSSFSSTLNNNLVTPGPQPSPVQYRPLPVISVTRPTPTPEQNLTPVQYRPHKSKSSKQIEDIPQSRSSFDFDQTSTHNQFRSKLSSNKPQKLTEEIPENQSTFDQTPIQYRSKPVKQQQQQQQRYVDDVSEARSSQIHQKPQLIPKKKLTQETDYYTSKAKKPVAQVIRRYREETDDGSIVWGFENDDGSYKEEIIGIDCITRGKYGYTDPDGMRREYTYETGIKCDEEEQQQEDILNTFVDYQENKLVLPNGKTLDLSNMGKKQSRRPQLAYRN